MYQLVEIRSYRWRQHGSNVKKIKSKRGKAIVGKIRRNDDFGYFYFDDFLKITTTKKS